MLRTLLRYVQTALCAWLMSAIVLVLAGFGFVGWFNVWRTADWVAVNGEIMRLKASNRGIFKRTSPQSGHCSVLRCSYTYTVSGRTYRNHRIGFLSGRPAAARSRQYKVLVRCQQRREEIQVWVDPSNPARAALFRPEVSSEMYFGPALAVFWFGYMGGIHGKRANAPEGRARKPRGGLPVAGSVCRRRSGLPGGVGPGRPALPNAGMGDRRRVRRHVLPGASTRNGPVLHTAVQHHVGDEVPAALAAVHDGCRGQRCRVSCPVRGWILRVLQAYALGAPPGHRRHGDGAW
ncbi:MAG: DUF3592 domain-containing protein [Candidatus Hydrogenedentes bacterium]|nr:DUF3592 domain-containing protein [Candidatus Hydrogenedentota bacterium]